MKNVFELLITTPLGYILKFIFSLVANNYGVTIIIFTIITKLCLLPLFVKQQKSTVAMQKLQPQIEALNKKYANQKTPEAQQRQQQELMKLYKENNVSPMGGCLPLLIQFPIIIGLYQVITRPMQYLMMLGTDSIQKIADLLLENKLITESIAKYALKQNQIGVARVALNNIDMIKEKLGISLMEMDFNFFGMDLSLTPSFSKMDLLWIIPILSAATAYLSNLIMQKMSGNTQQNQQMASMNIIMPLMSGYFCFIMPTGVGIYWIMSNVVSIIQQVLMTKFMKKDKDDTKETGVKKNG